MMQLSKTKLVKQAYKYVEEKEIIEKRQVRRSTKDLKKN